MSDLDDAYKLIDDWKKEIGEIPENTCPTINKCIKQIEEFEKEVEYVRKHAGNYNTPDDLANDLPTPSWNSATDILDGKLRKDNEKLRELGMFWYQKCIELAETFL